jgi:hypothetical protein
MVVGFFSEKVFKKLMSFTKNSNGTLIKLISSFLSP